MVSRATVTIVVALACAVTTLSGTAGAGTGGTAGAGAVTTRSADPPPVQPERGAAPEHDPTAAEERVADRLAGDPLQESPQPAQPIVGAAPSAMPREARPVRLTGNGAWTWYSDPRVLETADQTYLSYVTRGGSVVLTAVRNSDALLTSTVLSRYQLRDDHNVPALLETPDGRIAAFWAGHGRAPVRYRVSSRPGTITTMGGTRSLTGSGLEQANATYVQAFRMRGVSRPYHVLTRRHSDQNWVLTTSRDLKSWSKPVQLFKNSAWSVRTWPYVEAASAGWRQMHLAVTDGHPSNGIDTSLYHFTFDAATGTMRTSSGTAVRRPADPRSGTLVYDGESTDGRVRVYDLALRPDGQPAVAFTTIDRDPSTRGYVYKWAARRGSSWQTRTLARQTDYPEGISLDSTNGDRTYVVSRAGEETQLSELTTRDHGETWLARPMSLQPGTQRTPAAPSGTGGTYTAMWLHGDYRRYTDYDTGIIGESTGPAPLELRTSWPANWARGGGVRATVRAGLGGPGVSGREVWMLVRTPGAAERRVRSARTDAGGGIHLPVNRYYPKGTTVRLHVSRGGDWGAATSGLGKK